MASSLANAVKLVRRHKNGLWPAKSSSGVLVSSLENLVDNQSASPGVVNDSLAAKR